jgi:hypothetical protein
LSTFITRQTEVASGSRAESSMSSTGRPSDADSLAVGSAEAHASFLPTGTGVSISFHDDAAGFFGALFSLEAAAAPRYTPSGRRAPQGSIATAWPIV